MAKILIGNIKGPQGEQGPQGDQGPVGPQGPKGDTGPMPTLINNGTTTQAGVGALDAAYGKTLTDKDTDLQNQLNTLNDKTDGLEELLDSSSQVPGVTSGEKFVGYSNLYKFGSLYVLDILVVANNGYAVNDVVASLPVTIKNNIAAGRYLTSSNGAAMQIAAIGNQITAQNANSTPGTYGGIVVFFAN